MAFKEIIDDEVTIICYGEKEVMKRSEAIAFYQEAMEACDGSERDRYTNIYLSLINGDKICSDE